MNDYRRRSEPDLDEDLEQRKEMVNILMEHGISAARGEDLKRKANKVRQSSQLAISNVKRMIEDYQRELEQFMDRIALMEAAEVERLIGEIELQEELANNSGKPLSYFKVPRLHLAKRYRRKNGRE